MGRFRLGVGKFMMSWIHLKPWNFKLLYHVCMNVCARVHRSSNSSLKDCFFTKAQNSISKSAVKKLKVSKVDRFVDLGDKTSS